MPDIDKIKKEYKENLNQLSNSELICDAEETKELLKRNEQLKEAMEAQEELENVEKRIKENEKILNSKEDADIASLAQEEIVDLQKRRQYLEKEIKDASRKENGNKKPKSTIVEIRAGVGGEEAALFVADLFKMYSRYMENRGWDTKTLHTSSTEMGGFREIIFEIKNKEAWSCMQYEGGVHRVQRIPTTEKSGRIHTSTVSVAVLPKPTKTQLDIRPDELKIDHFRSSGPGGQNVNKRETAVRITHLKTGIVVASQKERNQLQNKENAMAILSARLLEKSESEGVEKIQGKRKAQVGQAKRTEKIRTYNFPQNRITDHRIKKSWHDLEKIMGGRMDPIIKTLRKNLSESSKD